MKANVITLEIAICFISRKKKQQQYVYSLSFLEKEEYAQVNF
jgi:hypothetical protein